LDFCLFLAIGTILLFCARLWRAVINKIPSSEFRIPNLKQSADIREIRFSKPTLMPNARRSASRSWLQRFLLKAGLLLIGVILLYWAFIFAKVVWWNYANPTETAFMTARLAEMRAKNPNATLRFQWVDYARIALPLKRAVVAAEDDRFLAHSGFDWENINRALAKNLEANKTVVGGSTISQQLAKNLFLSGDRSWIRKMREAIITVMIEAVWSKQRILEVYLNIAEWGDGIFGCQAAAQYYFGRSAANLNSFQAARLAVMLPNPRRYQHNSPLFLERHAQRVRERMYRSEVP
jgi:monofunctional biosynthetic peptidoglycan transglycosylase